VRESKNVILAEEMRDKFKTFIADRCGLYFKDHDLKSLENAVIERAVVCGVGSASDYYDLVTTSKNREAEFRELLNLLTINHTYFFRNESHFRALKEKILPGIVERKRREAALKRKSAGSENAKPTLRVWSAGCSTGEEPYSIAMVVRDVIKDPDEWDVEISAPDASTYALSRARKAVYAPNVMKLLSREYKQKNFVEKKDARGKKQYELISAIKKMVHFDYLNLIGGQFPRGFDIIFCRNVVIYFELETVIGLMNRFYSSLNDTGTIFIGYSETLQFMPDKFKMKNWEDAIFYGKTKNASQFDEKVSPRSSIIQSQKAAEKIVSERAAAELRAEEKVSEEKKVVLSRKIKSLLVEITKELYLKRYDSALSLIREAEAIDKNAPQPHYLAAEIRANQGRFREAKDQLEVVLTLDALFVPAHYLFGTIYLEEEDLEHAKVSLKKALYLDGNFSLAHYSLANIYRREGKRDDAVRAYRNTLKVLSQGAPDDIIPYSGGFNVETLLSICRNNIERLKIEE